MRLLAVDTATFVGSVALVEGERVLAEASERVTTHSERLLPLIERVLAGAGARLADLDAVACGAGPGSFTGLRIGLATAKGLCWAAGKPLVLASSLAALALNVAPTASLVVPLIDARKGEVFAGFFRRGAGLPEAVAPEVVLPPVRLRARLAGEDAVIVGEGVSAYPEALAGLRVADAPPELRAAHVAALARARLARGERDDLASAGPTYLRASDAERVRGR